MFSPRQEDGRIFFSVVLALSLGAALYSFATARKVSIIAQDQQISLVNPSSATVSYDVTCYSTSGSAVLNQAGQALSAQSNRKISRTPCGSGSSGSGSTVYPSIISTDQTAVSCGGYVYDGANYCPAGTTLCSRAALVSKTIIQTGSGAVLYGVSDYNQYGSSGSIYYNFGGTSYSGYDMSSYGLSYYNDPTYYCSNTSSGGVSHCNHFYIWNWTNLGCCSDGSGTFIPSISYCDVTVQPGTGHLQSPQFKGGAPF